MEIETHNFLFIIIFIIAVSYFSGVGMGFVQGIDWAVGIGLNFIDIDVDETAIKQGIFNYQNRIDECFNEERTLGKVVSPYAVESIF